MGGSVDTGGWSDAIEGRHPPQLSPDRPLRVGVLPGEGCGPEVVAAAVSALEAVSAARGLRLELAEGPAFRAGERADGGVAEATVEFCRDTFAAGGAVLAGAHGGRWVYELRRRLDLFCKLSPLRPSPAIGEVAAAIAPSRLDGVDVVIVREQTGGVYQGRWGEHETREQGRVAEHSFSYGQRQVRRIVQVAATLARRRRGRLAVIVKDGGVPAISRLWRETVAELDDEGLELESMDIDYAVYRLFREPQELDVIVAPNLFGDVLCDAGGALVGSRGVTFSGNFDSTQAAVYQTNHGAAHDLAGRDQANPAGQILAAAMLLRESFGLVEEAALIEAALSAAWRQGWRTPDLREPGSRVVGTREMGERVAEGISRGAGTGAATAPAEQS